MESAGHLTKVPEASAGRGLCLGLVGHLMLKLVLTVVSGL